jgi:hypothetical protein
MEDPSRYGTLYTLVLNFSKIAKKKTENKADTLSVIVDVLRGNVFMSYELIRFQIVKMMETRNQI